MADEVKWYVRMEDGKVYGPAGVKSLVEWAKDGRVEPTSFVSQDRKSWRPAQTMPELEMKWLVETEPGKVFGPFNRAVAAGPHGTCRRGGRRAGRGYAAATCARFDLRERKP